MFDASLPRMDAAYAPLGQNLHPARQQAPGADGDTAGTPSLEIHRSSVPWTRTGNTAGSSPHSFAQNYCSSVPSRA